MREQDLEEARAREARLRQMVELGERERAILEEDNAALQGQLQELSRKKGETEVAAMVNAKELVSGEKILQASNLRDAGSQQRATLCCRNTDTSIQSMVEEAVVLF